MVTVRNIETHLTRYDAIIKNSLVKTNGMAMIWSNLNLKKMYFTSFDYHYFYNYNLKTPSGEGRTHTGLILSQLPLPIGLQRGWPLILKTLNKWKLELVRFELTHFRVQDGCATNYAKVPWNKDIIYFYLDRRQSLWLA